MCQDQRWKWARLYNFFAGGKWEGKGEKRRKGKKKNPGFMWMDLMNAWEWEAEETYTLVMRVPNYCRKKHKIIVLIRMTHSPDEWLQRFVQLPGLCVLPHTSSTYWGALKLLVMFMVKYKTCLKTQTFIKRFAKVHGRFEWTWTELWFCNDIVKNLWCSMKHSNTPHLQRQSSARQHLTAPAC